VVDFVHAAVAIPVGAVAIKSDPALQSVPVAFLHDLLLLCTYHPSSPTTSTDSYSYSHSYYNSHPPI